MDGAKADASFGLIVRIRLDEMQPTQGNGASCVVDLINVQVCKRGSDEQMRWGRE